MTDGRMHGKVAVVTGGGNGIGRACCLRLAAEGAAVVVADLQLDKAEETVALVEAEGGRARSIGIDVTSAASAGPRPEFTAGVRHFFPCPVEYDQPLFAIEPL